MSWQVSLLLYISCSERLNSPSSSPRLITASIARAVCARLHSCGSWEEDLQEPKAAGCFVPLADAKSNREGSEEEERRVAVNRIASPGNLRGDGSTWRMYTRTMTRGWDMRMGRAAAASRRINVSRRNKSDISWRFSPHRRRRARERAFVAVACAPAMLILGRYYSPRRQLGDAVIRRSAAPRSRGWSSTASVLACAAICRTVDRRIVPESTTQVLDHRMFSALLIAL